MIPAIEGQLIIRKGKGLMVSSKMRYFQVLSTHGVIVKFQSKEQLTELSPRKLDYYNMKKKDQEKYKIEVIQLTSISSLDISEREEFKSKSQHALEMNL
jgi:hypothetical protein